jgi:hypothetical protein
MTDPAAPPTPGPPGTGLGVIGLVFDFIISPLGLILSIMAKVQSNRAGVKNGVATLGIILGIVFTIGGAIVAVLIGIAVIGQVSECAQLGDGTHVVGNLVYTCTPGRTVVGVANNGSN